MFFYKRKTSFIAYYINGIKSRSIGVVKQCLTEEGLRLSVDLFGLEDWKNMRCRVSIGNARDRQQVFETDVCNGRGGCEYNLSVEALCKINASKIFFALGNDCYGIADLCEVPEYITHKQKDGNMELTGDAEQPEEDMVMKNRETEVCCQAADTEVPVQKTDDKEVNDSANIKENELSDIANDTVCAENEQEQELLGDCLEPQPDRWEVIKKKYPILYPFKGQGPYVSIKPVDLQLLDSGYSHLSNNSFLMHNFYRYKHLILGEYAWEKGTFFYVGVPGEFVKKEQDMAAMFGFEGYEHSGDLGYYLYRVAL